MVSVMLFNILYTKFINYQGEQDMSPFVAPETRGMGALLIVMLEETCLHRSLARLTY